MLLRPTAAHCVCVCALVSFMWFQLGLGQLCNWIDDYLIVDWLESLGLFVLFYISFILIGSLCFADVRRRCIRTISLVPVWWSYSIMKHGPLCSERCTASLTGHQDNCWRKSCWWMMLAREVSVFVETFLWLLRFVKCNSNKHDNSLIMFQNS